MSGPQTYCHISKALPAQRFARLSPGHAAPFSLASCLLLLAPDPPAKKSWPPASSVTGNSSSEQAWARSASTVQWRTRARWVCRDAPRCPWAETSPDAHNLLAALAAAGARRPAHAGWPLRRRWAMTVACCSATCVTLEAADATAAAATTAFVKLRQQPAASS